jgi:hypothetical protein
MIQVTHGRARIFPKRADDLANRDELHVRMEQGTAINERASWLASGTLGASSRSFGTIRRCVGNIITPRCRRGLRESRAGVYLLARAASGRRPRCRQSHPVPRRRSLTTLSCRAVQSHYEVRRINETWRAASISRRIRERRLGPGAVYSRVVPASNRRRASHRYPVAADVASRPLRAQSAWRVLHDELAGAS